MDIFVGCVECISIEHTQVFRMTPFLQVSIASGNCLMMSDNKQ